MDVEREEKEISDNQTARATNFSKHKILRQPHIYRSRSSDGRQLSSLPRKRRGGLTYTQTHQYIYINTMGGL